MPSQLFDPAPRDDIEPPLEDMHRGVAQQEINPEEMVGPDYPLPEEPVTRAKLPPLAWPPDREAPDYAHLEPQGREPVVGDKTFKITGAEIDRLIKANGFQPKGPDGRFVIAIRGANLVDAKDGIVEGVDHITLEETRPNHKTFRCVLGYYHPGTRKFWAYRGSTVPGHMYISNYYLVSNHLGGDPSKGGVNMLPTGCYVFRVGPHKGEQIFPALRLTDSQKVREDGAATVLRSKKDMIFTTDDVWDNTVTQDHVHCAYSDEEFWSAGCLTVQGKNGQGGPWTHFQKVLKGFKRDTRIDLMLLTGRDASIAAYLSTTGRADDSDYAERLLGRLRPGSNGDAVSRLQAKLGMQPSGYFGPSTKEALIAFQHANTIPTDGIWSPALDDKLGLGILKPAPATAPAPAAAPVAVAAAPAPAPTAPAGGAGPTDATMAALAALAAEKAKTEPAPVAMAMAAPAPVMSSAPSPAPMAAPTPAPEPAPEPAARSVTRGREAAPSPTMGQQTAAMDRPAPRNRGGAVTGWGVLLLLLALAIAGLKFAENPRLIEVVSPRDMIDLGVAGIVGVAALSLVVLGRLIARAR